MKNCVHSRELLPRIFSSVLLNFTDPINISLYADTTIRRAFTLTVTIAPFVNEVRINVVDFRVTGSSNRRKSAAPCRDAYKRPAYFGTRNRANLRTNWICLTMRLLRATNPKHIQYTTPCTHIHGSFLASARDAKYDSDKDRHTTCAL